MSMHTRQEQERDTRYALTLVAGKLRISKDDFRHAKYALEHCPTEVVIGEYKAFAGQHTGDDRRNSSRLITEHLEESYMNGYASESEYDRDCRLTGFHQGMAAGVQGGPDTYQGDGYLMASEGFAALQEGYEAGYAMGSRLGE